MLSRQTDIKPHYILYVDLNGTIMAGDSSNNKGIEDALWQIICENIKSTWPIERTLPMTFRQYIERCLCKGTEGMSKSELKKLQREFYREIVPHLRLHSHPLAGEVKSIFMNMKKKLLDENIYQDDKGATCQGNIFPAFYVLIDYLEKHKFNYSIVLSTFGDDLDLVIKELEARTMLRFPKNVRVRFENGELIDTLGQHLVSSKQIEDFFKSGKCFAVKHDWPYWNKNGEKYEYGKPFPIHLNNTTNMIAIFFDDNAVDKQIIAVKPLDESKPNQEIVQNNLRQSKHIVPVNAFNVILNDQYFVEYIQYHHQLTSKNVFSSLYKNEIKLSDEPKLKMLTL